MTLEEAIKHCEEVADKYCEKVEDGLTADDFCDSCASEHRQLADWLRELKAYREILANADKLIESEYGYVIIEGYADVVAKMNEVFKEANAEDKESDNE